MKNKFEKSFVKGHKVLASCLLEFLARRAASSVGAKIRLKALAGGEKNGRIWKLLLSRGTFSLLQLIFAAAATVSCLGRSCHSGLPKNLLITLQHFEKSWQRWNVKSVYLNASVLLYSLFLWQPLPVLVDWPWLSSMSQTAAAAAATSAAATFIVIMAGDVSFL